MLLHVRKKYIIKFMKYIKNETIIDDNMIYKMAFNMKSVNDPTITRSGYRGELILKLNDKTHQCHLKFNLGIVICSIIGILFYKIILLPTFEFI